MAATTLDTVYFTLTITGRIIAIAVILQTIELFQIRRTFAEDGIWRWSTLKDEFEIFPRPLRGVLDFFLKMPNFQYLLLARVLAAVVLLFAIEPISLAILFFSSLAISLRWRGTFNGGSDYMTLLILLALLAVAISGRNPEVEMGAVWYIALQTCSSYFIAGVVKIRKRSWRSGRALAGFLDSAVYPPPPLLEAALRSRGISSALSLGIIAFECLSPISLLNPTICGYFLAFAMCFHLANYYLFGLNRFLFAWAAAYPALFYCCLYISVSLID